MSVLKICEIGNPVLRRVTENIPNVHDATVQQLASDLMDTLKSTPGLGIAAPQIGVSLRMCIISSRPSLRYPNAEQFDPIVMINPVVISSSLETREGYEGCLSFMGYRAKVRRNLFVLVDYIGLTGEKKSIHLEGIPAIVVQHELDHLNGIMFIDKCDLGTMMSDSEFDKMMATQKK